MLKITIPVDNFFFKKYVDLHTFKSLNTILLQSLLIPLSKIYIQE